VNQLLSFVLGLFDGRSPLGSPSSWEGGPGGDLGYMPEDAFDLGKDTDAGQASGSSDGAHAAGAAAPVSGKREPGMSALQRESLNAAVRGNAALLSAYCAGRAETEATVRAGAVLLLTDAWRQQRWTLAAFLDSMHNALPSVTRDAVSLAVNEELEIAFAEWTRTQARLGLLYDKSMSPIDYERFCARRLASHGWTTEVTRASGDQGADIIGSKNGVRAVFQAKKYQSNVGNDAVQQVFAARTYYHATLAAVVSTGGFTLSARELASATGVHLLHHDQLGGISPGLDHETEATLAAVRPAPWHRVQPRRRKR